MESSFFCRASMRFGKRASVVGLSLVCFCTAAVATVPFTIQGPGVNPGDFRMTTFATGANFPIGMVELDDGSILVAESDGGFFGSGSGRLVRYVDDDQDGVSDSKSDVANVPFGGLTTLRRAGDLVFTTGQGRGKPISIYRLGANPTDPLTQVGSMTLNYPDGGWLHPHSALSVRDTPGVPGSYDLVFQLGSKTNADLTTDTVGFTSDIGVSGTLNGDALYMVTITDNGSSVSGSNLTQIATGLRNSAGHAFHPDTGDLWLQDNGIDGIAPTPAQEPTSADELNVIAAADIGGAIEDFGFPSTYVEYRTGNQIGSTGILPEFAYLPIPNPADGSEAEGPNDIAFAPSTFPEALSNGVFVTMHGQFSQGGLANEENPLVFSNLDDSQYFHFIGNDERSVGHLDGLLTTQDSLFIADLSPRGGLGSREANTGVIYQITRIIPEPASASVAMIGMLGAAAWRRRRSSAVRVGSPKAKGSR